MKKLSLFSVAWVAMTMAVLFASPCIAQTRQEVLNYVIPPNALRREGGSRDPKEKNVVYYLPNAEPSQATLIAIEKRAVKGDMLLSRELYKNQILHGVQKEWHKNGQLMSDSPYFEGVRDGVFRHWDEKGQLVGKYQITKGVGIIKIYNSQGLLVKEVHLVIDEKQRALDMQVYSLGQRSLTWKKGPFPDGPSYSFYSDDSMWGIAFYLSLPGAADHIFHGPYIRFDERGNVTKKEWDIRGRRVSEKEYAKVAATNKSLPPYFADANKYKTFTTPETKALLKKYREMRPVKIPLEFDGKGEPLLSPVQEKSKAKRKP